MITLESSSPKNMNKANKNNNKYVIIKDLIVDLRKTDFMLQMIRYFFGDLLFQCFWIS